MNTAQQTIRIIGHYLLARWRWRWLQGERLHAYQEKRARRMVAFANHHAPFYRDHWSGHDLQCWRELPTVDKQRMMANFQRFNTAGVPLEDAMQTALQAETSRDFRPTTHGLTVGLSSGTSGHRGLFLISPAEQAAWAGVILARLLPPRLPAGGLRAAFFLRANSNLYEQTRSRLVQFRYFDLLQPWELALPVLNDFQPHMLIAPPQLLGLLAEAQRSDHLRIHPSRVLSVAEVLEPQDRAEIEATFEAPVAQVYQATEGLLAAPCFIGNLHVQEDLVALQFQPLQSASDTGAPQTIIVTDLHRRTQPIIRYQLNDLVYLAPEACRCGSSYRLIRAIEGRADDILYFPRPSGRLQAIFPDAIRRTLLMSGDAIQDYQVFQEQPGSLRIHIQVDGGASMPAPGALNQGFARLAPAVEQAFVETLAQSGCQVTGLQIIPGLLPLAPGAKRRRVRRLWNETTNNSLE